MNNNSQTRKAANAFTLIEIMIVVLIIGILLGIAVPNFVRAREASRAKSCIANLKALDGAYQQWMMQGNRDAMTPPPDSVETLVAAGFLKSAPECPSGGDYAPSGTYQEVAKSAYTCSTARRAQPGDPLAHVMPGN